MLTDTRELISSCFTTKTVEAVDKCVVMVVVVGIWVLTIASIANSLVLTDAHPVVMKPADIQRTLPGVTPSDDPVTP